MAYPDDLIPEIENDFSVWNDVETVSYFSKTTEQPPPTGVAVTNTLWLMVKKDNLPADHPLIQMDRTVEIPGVIVRALVPPIVPKANDIMQRADGTRWTVKLVEHPAEIDWRVHVIKSTKT